MRIFDKVFIGEAAKLLELQDKPIDQVTHALINEENLTAYFDQNVYATHFSGYTMRQINEEGDKLPFVDGQPPFLVSGLDKKILTCDIEDGSVSVHTFEHEDKNYCGSDEEGDHPKPIIIKLDYIYFERSEINSVQELPPYQDEQHEHYAPELDLAIQLHQVIYTDKYGNQSQRREVRINSWLNANLEKYEFSVAALERLSTIIGNKPLKEKKK